jgi:hypothetical protein
MSHDAVPRALLPEARRRATFKSFTRDPVKRSPKTSRNALDALVRYNPGDVHHGHSHDIKYLDQWMKTLKSSGADAGLAELAPQYLASQAKVHEKIMKELLFQTSIAHPKLARLIKRVWDSQSKLLYSTISSVHRQARGYRNSQVELHSLAERSGLHAKRLQSDKERLAFNQVLVEDRLFHANVDREVALRRVEELETELRATQEIILQEIAGESDDDDGEGAGKVGMSDAPKRKLYRRQKEGKTDGEYEETYGSDEDEEFKEWHLKKKIEIVNEFSSSMEGIHMKTTHEHRKQSKLLKDLSKTVRVTEKKLLKLSSLYGPRKTADIGVETPEEWKESGGDDPNFEQDPTAPEAPPFKLRGLKVPFRLRKLLKKFKKNERVMARDKVSRAILQIYLTKNTMDKRRPRDLPGLTPLTEAFLEYSREKAGQRAPRSPASPGKSAHVDVIYEILNGVRNVGPSDPDNPRMTMFGNALGIFDDPMKTTPNLLPGSIDFLVSCLARLQELDFLPAAIMKDTGGGSMLKITMDRGMATSKLRQNIIGVVGASNMSLFTGRVNLLQSQKDMGGERMVSLDRYLELLVQTYEDADDQWNARLRAPFEKRCKWYKRQFGMVVEMDEQAIMRATLSEEGLVDDGHNTFGVIDFEQWCGCLSEMNFKVNKQRQTEWFNEGCKMHQDFYTELYQEHWKEATVGAEGGKDEGKTFWYNEATNGTAWTCPQPPSDGTYAYTEYELDFASFAKICKKKAILRAK